MATVDHDVTDGFSTSTDDFLWSNRSRIRGLNTPDVHSDHVASPVDSQVLADPRGTRLFEDGHPAFPKPEKKNRHWVRNLVILAVVGAIVWAIVRFGIPAVRWYMITASTDDAFVAGHTTYVSPRVEDLVTEVLVDQDDRVEPGMLLVRLDREPYAIAVAQAEASVREAKANLDMARASVRAQLATARGNWFRRKNAQEQIRRQVTSLRAQVAALRARESSQKLAEIDRRRIEALVRRGSASQSELDQRNNTLDVNNEQVKEAWAAIQETRAALGLAPNQDDPLDVPADLEQKQSNIESAVSDIATSLAQVGIPFDAHDIQPDQAFEQIIGLDSSESLDNAFGRVIEKAPAVAVALASVVQAERSLDDANRKLGYTEIRAEVAGHVQDRQVHPGNRVAPGQNLLSIRPDYVWVDANFKETQLDDIRIGQPVELRVDAYPKRKFKARVAGFSPGTGLSQSLLPPQNATGNYIKVTQRLPVRLELVEPAPEETPLFVGLSVVPYVLIKEQPTGPNAGKRLHHRGASPRIDAGDGPAGDRPENRDVPAPTGGRAS